MKILKRAFLDPELGPESMFFYRKTFIKRLFLSLQPNV